MCVLRSEIAYYSNVVYPKIPKHCSEIVLGELDWDLGASPGIYFWYDRADGPVWPFKTNDSRSEPRQAWTKS